MSQPPVQLPAEGRWAAAVSGGADSVSMLLLCLAHGGPQTGRVSAVVHVDHETRAGASAGDAAFVADLCARLALPVTVVRRSEVEGQLGPEAPKSTSARFRAVRHLAFRSVVEREGLAGVLLAHHADDQAETVAMRLIRGSSFAGLGGMAAETQVAGVRLHRPVLGWTRQALRAYLAGLGQRWCEDASNDSPAYGRNRVRRVLEGDPRLREALLALAAAARGYRAALERAGVDVQEEVWPVGVFGAGPVGRHRARRWLGRWVSAGELSEALVERTLAWSADAAGPTAMMLPGGLQLRRRRGQISLEPPREGRPGRVPPP